ncbi:DUF2017 family protein [Nocardioides sp. W3-2-3]|nr:DUF2017 family protein [Nocardioides convexus]
MVATDRDPLEALLDFSGPTTEPEDPVLRRLFPNAYRDDDESAAEFRRFTEGGLRDGKARAAGTVIDVLEEAGLPSEPTEEDLVIDVEPGPAHGAGLAARPHRPAARARHPAGRRGGRRGVLVRPPRRGPAGSGAPHLRVARLPPGDPGQDAGLTASTGQCASRMIR